MSKEEKNKNINADHATVNPENFLITLTEITDEKSESSPEQTKNKN